MRSAWPGRLYLAATVALLWAALHYVVDATVLPRGLDRPVCVFVGDGGVVPAVVVLILLTIAALIGTWLGGRRAGTQGLLVVGFALALWAYHGGTMDEWLKMKNPIPGPPSGSAYAPLLAEYLYWAVVVAAVYALTGRRGPTASKSSTNLRDGITALIVTVAVAAVLILILSGPRIGHTYRGQVYFAVAVAFILGVMAARRLTGTRRLLWYLPAPLIVGIIGVLLATSRPGLGPAYANINVIPAWALVRPLPIEMVGVGLVAILLTLRTADRLSSKEDQN
jgi:hypothetical protein